MSQLIEWQIEAGPFYCLEELPACLTSDKAIVFLHGLGENRSGLNYLFHDLSDRFTLDGFAVYRFDLAGCGESVLQLSFQLWREQLAVVTHYLQKYRAVHLVARGIASFLLPKYQAGSIAIGPITGDYFHCCYPKIPIEENAQVWIPKANRSLSSEWDYFWFGLGIEAGCLGGFYLPKAFLHELEDVIYPIPSEWSVIYGGKNWPYSLPAKAHVLSECHPLFVYQKDRAMLYNKLTRLFNASTESMV